MNETPIEEYLRLHPERATRRDGREGECAGCSHPLGEHLEKGHCLWRGPSGDERCSCRVARKTSSVRRPKKAAPEPAQECICRHPAHPGGPCTWTSGPPEFVSPVMCGCREFTAYPRGLPAGHSAFITSAPARKKRRAAPEPSEFPVPSTIDEARWPVNRRGIAPTDQELADELERLGWVRNVTMEAEDGDGGLVAQRKGQPDLVVRHRWPEGLCHAVAWQNRAGPKRASSRTSTTPPPKPPPADTPHWFTPLEDFLRWEGELMQDGLIPRPFDLDPFGHPEAPVSLEIAKRPGAKVAVGLELGRVDGLAVSWAGGVVWVNTGPYRAGHLMIVAEKMNAEAPMVDGMAWLGPNWRDRKWFQEEFRPGIDAGSIVARDLAGRLNFGWPGCPGGHKRRGAKFPGLLLIWPGIRPAASEETPLPVEGTEENCPTRGEALGEPAPHLWWPARDGNGWEPCSCGAPYSPEDARGHLVRTGGDGCTGAR